MQSVKIGSLKDGWDYEVSVSCRLITGNPSYSDLKAGPYRVTTKEQGIHMYIHISTMNTYSINNNISSTFPVVF